jgi:hypothetical protein
VAFGFGVAPDFLDLPIGPDQDRTASDTHERSAHEFFHAPSAVSLEHAVLGITEEREIQFLLGLETRQGFFGVGACAEYDHAQLVELLLCVAKLGRFDRSTGRVGLGKEEQDNAFAAKIRQRYFLTLIGFQTEGRSLVTSVEHECTSAYQR